MLARLRFDAARGRGRRFPEPEHPFRNPYQRDRDRIVHSRAFRRLERKTQVFTEPYSDHFRNRLTHTIEVAQIARTVAGALELNGDLVETLALAHDIGHPPFGHAGEQALDAEMARFGERFDHNLHALRIVEDFERRYAGFAGLNLTFEVREGLVKHSRDYEAAAHPDLAEYLLELRPPIEAQLIDPADEIAYNTADLDDAVDARLLEIEQVRAEVALFDDAFAESAAKWPAASPRLLFHEALRRTVDMLVRGLIEGSRRAAEEAGVETPDDVRRHPRRLAVPTPETAEASRALKALLARKVYRSAALERESLGAAEKMAELFRFYLRMPDKLPGRYAERARREPVHRVARDYVAGMTDPFLLRRHAEVFGAPSGRGG